MIGTTVGSYSISAKLGAGGMGEVFRATDSRLGRDVAIKFSAEHFSDRFEREARAVAALNHPNICTLFDVGPNYLVMELVEGPTLAERIAEGPIPIDQALVIARQIASALAAAHEQGIVHRDLKPGNIKIKPDGSVKVLDFGLAKIGGTTTSSVVDSPTISLGATQAGMILGTAAYMSPEQARGRSVDKRADIWAFGVVLFEMVTGRRLFEGDDISVTLASVIKEEPDWNRAPVSLRRLLRKCLAKDPSKRLHDIGDLDLLLDDVASAPQATLAPTPSRGPRWMWPVLFGAALLVIALLAIPALQHTREAPPTEMRLDIVTPTTDAPLEFALSPDSRHIVFVASDGGIRKLWVRALDRTDAHILAGTDGASYPFWSADGKSIGFFAVGKLFRTDVAGGQPQSLTSAPLGRGGAWGPDGTILFSPTSSSGLMRISASGGERTNATKVVTPGQSSHRFPIFLPDGRHFLFYAQGTAEALGVYLASLDGGEPKRLTASDSHAAFLAPDRIAFVRQGTLVARSLDLGRGELTGEAITVADPVGFDVTALGAFSVSLDGRRLAYRTGGGAKSQLTWFDQAGKVTGVVGEPEDTGIMYPDVSPDGRRVAVARTLQGNQDVYLMDRTRGGMTRFTFDASSDLNPVWSPDGANIAFMSLKNGIFNIYSKPSSGAGKETLLLESPNTKVPQDWSQDYFLFYELSATTGRDLWAIDMRTKDRKPFVVANTPFEETLAELSPDGQWVAYQTNEGTRFEIVVQAFPQPNGKWQVSTGGGVTPRWGAGGKVLYFIAPDGKLMSSTVTTAGSKFDSTTPVALFPTRIVGGGGVTNNRAQYAVRDGQFLINQLLVESSVAPITLLLDWKAASRK